MKARSPDPIRHWWGRPSWLGDFYGNRDGDMMSATVGDGRAPATRVRKHQQICMPHKIWFFWLHPRVHLLHGALRGPRHRYQNFDALSGFRRHASAFVTSGRGSSLIVAREFGCCILDDTGGIIQAATFDGSVCLWIVNTFLSNMRVR